MTIMSRLYEISEDGGHTWTDRWMTDEDVKIASYNFWCIREKQTKNTNAIEKIIAECAMRDYLAFNPRRNDGRPKYKKHHPYTLSAETNEAREIKRQYLADEISEEEYKAFCLKYNLIHRKEA